MRTVNPLRFTDENNTEVEPIILLAVKISLPESLLDDDSGQGESRDDDRCPEEALAQVSAPLRQVAEAVQGRLVTVVPAVADKNTPSASGRGA